MQNNSKLNTVLLIILIILIGVGIWFLADRDGNEIGDNQIVGTPVANDQSELSFVPGKPLVSDSPIIWMKSPQFGLYYPSYFNVTEYFQGPTGEQLPESQGGTPYFRASYGERETTISWQGTCNDYPLPPFQYGISNEVCAKDRRATLSFPSARLSATPEELKVFGDFVLKNQ